MKIATPHSVHLSKFPLVDLTSGLQKYNANVNIINQIDFIKDLCGSVLSIRKKHSIRTRMPLSYLKISLSGTNFVISKDLEDVISNEVNVKNISFVDLGPEKILQLIKLNFKNLGVSFGSNVAFISGAIKNNDYKLQDNGDILVGDFVLKPNEHFTLTNTLAQNAFNPKNEDYFIIKNVVVIVAIVAIAVNQNCI